MKHKHIYHQNSAIIGKEHGSIQLICDYTKKSFYCGKTLVIYWGDDKGDIEISNPYESFKRIIEYNDKKLR
jgi:hypothetical protein